MNLEPSKMGPILRLDRYLKKKYPELSNQNIRLAIKLGLVRSIDGTRLSKSHLVTDIGLIEDSDLASQLISKPGRAVDEHPGLRDIQLFKETNDLLALYKPPNLPSHRVHFNDISVLDWVRNYDPSIFEAFPQATREISPHRLDSATAGLLLVAKNYPVYLKWRGRFSAHQVTKTYRAWCLGSAKDHKPFVTEFWMGRHGRRSKRVLCTSWHPGDHKKLHARGRWQKTECSVTPIRKESWRGVAVTLFEIKTTTGFTHQVRAHLSSIGFPLVGDRDYGTEESRALSNQFSHHLLWATQVECEDDCFSLPEKYIPMDVRSIEESLR